MQISYLLCIMLSGYVHKIVAFSYCKMQKITDEISENWIIGYFIVCVFVRARGKEGGQKLLNALPEGVQGSNSATKYLHSPPRGAHSQ